MDLKKKTFEDLIGNFADDAKKALDEILERDTTKGGSPVGATPAASNLIGTAGGAGATVGALGNTINDLNTTVGSLASLPEQIARLSQLIERLMPALEAMTGALGAAGKANPAR